MKTAESASHLAHETVDKIASAANQAADAIGEKSEQIKNAEKQMMDQCRGYIRDNPVASLGMAVAAGFLLSRLLGSR